MANPRDDLTGAALVGLMLLSFAEQGIDLPSEAPTLRPNTPHASFTSKAAMADWVLKRYGPQALLKVGDAVPRVAFDPIGAALLAAKDGPDLLSRWARLERYVHTRHPIEFRTVSEREAVLAHFGDPADPPPPSVDFLLAGVIAGLLRAVGCARLSLTMGEGRNAVAVVIEGEVTKFDHAPHPTGVWHLAWTDEAPDARLGTELPDWQQKPLSRVAGKVLELIAADLLIVPSLPRLAAMLGQSTRSLQRRLAQDGVSVQTLRRTAQVRKASEMLLGSQASLSSIGFVCGFTDAAHFTRSFKRASGMSPKAFRQASRGTAQ